MEKKQKHGGRKKGTPNKVTADLRQWISELIDQHRPTILRDIKSPEISPAQRLAFFEKLFGYVIPKQTATAVTLDNISDEQLQQLITEITKDIES